MYGSRALCTLAALGAHSPTVLLSTLAALGAHSPTVLLSTLAALGAHSPTVLLSTLTALGAHSPTVLLYCTDCTWSPLTYRTTVLHWLHLEPLTHLRLRVGDHLASRVEIVREEEPCGWDPTDML
jgi:hypothetical protein